MTMPALRSVASFFALALLAALLAPSAQAQERSSALPRTSPNATLSQTVGVTDVHLTYGRPSVNGRDIFGGLVPYGEVWRAGANEATTIRFDDDVRIEGQPLAAGTYGFFTVPGPEEWTLIFNDQAEQWGAYEYDETQDALRVEVPAQEAPHAHEQMGFRFSNVTNDAATVSLVWADVRVPFRLETDTDANVRTRAETAAAEASDWRAPLRYAAYALENDVYREAALDWASRSMAMQETFQGAATKARLLAELERYDEARPLAERAFAMAEGMDEAPRGLDAFRQQVDGWPER